MIEGIRLVVTQGTEGEDCQGLGYFENGELVGQVELQMTALDYRTGNLIFTKVPVLIVKDEGETDDKDNRVSD